jgi:hypothetical protein
MGKMAHEAPGGASTLSAPYTFDGLQWIAPDGMQGGSVMDYTGDVAIIGAGPVGMTLALALAHRGHSVVVLEQRPRDELPPVKSNHVSARSMELFRRLAIAADVRRAGLPPDFPHDVCFRTAHASITAAFGTKAEAVSQNGELAFVSARTGAGQRVAVSARFAVGCEGASSLLRHTIGAGFRGDAVVQRTRSAYIDAPDLLRRLRSAPAWGNFSFNRQRSGMVNAIDGMRKWLVHDYLAGHEEFSELDIWVPFGGYGMNAGLADAQSLAWSLAACLEGWGGPRVLGAYQAERMPITEQVSKMAMEAAIAIATDRHAVPDHLDEPGAGGEAARREFGTRVYERSVQQYCAAGLNFGYYYSGSPIIAEDGETAPSYTMGHYEPSAVPGVRFPHLWLEPETRSLYDMLGPGFTLVSVSGEHHERVRRAAADLKIPLRAVLLPPSAAREPWFDHDMYLVRQDTHVVWRGTGEVTDFTGSCGASAAGPELPRDDARRGSLAHSRHGCQDATARRGRCGGRDSRCPVHGIDKAGRVDDLQPAQHRPDLAGAVIVQGAGRVLPCQGPAARADRDDEVAALRGQAGELGDDAAGIGNRKKVQHRRQDDRERPAGLDQRGHAGTGQDRGRLGGVPLDGDDIVAAGQQRVGVPHDHRVLIDVRHPAVRRGRLRDIVSVASGRQPGSDVDELPDAAVGGEPVHGAAEKHPVLLGEPAQVRLKLQQPLGFSPVGLEIIRSA